jgi:hypothetical protein
LIQVNTFTDLDIDKTYSKNGGKMADDEKIGRIIELAETFSEIHIMDSDELGVMAKELADLIKSSNLSKKMTWKIVKERIEELGVTDTTEIDYIDIYSSGEFYIHNENDLGVGICSK